jgi:hypothetical protein
LKELDALGEIVMPVGHGGCMSKHTAWEKVVILELLERRIKWAARKADVNPINVRVYDPFTTEMDFFIFFDDVSWEKYLEIYHWYYREDLPAFDENYKELTSNARAVIKEILMTENVDYEKYREAFDKAMDAIKLYDAEEIFNASTSKTMILYSVRQMKNILTLGHP